MRELCFCGGAWGEAPIPMYEDGGGGFEYGMYHSSSCDLRVDFGRRRMNGSTMLMTRDVLEPLSGVERRAVWKEVEDETS